MEISSIKMSGEELYNKLSKRDYSGSDADQYAQLLQTLHLHLTLNKEEEDFYNMLLQAEKEGKKLAIIDDELDEYSFETISLV